MSCASASAVAERLLEPAGHLAGLGERLPLLPRGAHQRSAELAREASGEADQPFAVFFEQVAVDPGLEVEALEVGLGGQLEEVGEADAVAGEQREVVAGIPLAARVLLEPAPRRDVGLVADDRVDLRRLRGLVELESPVKVAVVGDGQGGHAQFDRAVDQPFDRTRPVEEAVVAVAVEVGERLRAHPWASRGGAAV